MANLLEDEHYMNVSDIINFITKNGVNQYDKVNFMFYSINFAYFNQEENKIILKFNSDSVLKVNKPPLLVNTFVGFLLNTNLDAKLYYMNVPIVDAYYINLQQAISNFTLIGSEHSDYSDVKQKIINRFFSLISYTDDDESTDVIKDIDDII